MKIRIQGCTQRELDEYCGYLTVGKDYEVEKQDGRLRYITGDTGGDVVALFNHPEHRCPHLPKGAKWVEVTEC